MLPPIMRRVIIFSCLDGFLFRTHDPQNIICENNPGDTDYYCDRDGDQD
jgi:hypothetical protein